jgi:ATP-dependent DNA helicase PIF1
MSIENFNIPTPDSSTDLREESTSTTNHNGRGETPAPSVPYTIDNRSYDDLVMPPSLLITEFITGSAGTGKTTEIRNRRAADPDGVVVAATTGIAAVNLGPEVTTVHSLLRFFDYNSLVDAYKDHRLQDNIRRLADGGMRELVVDEISMFSGPALDVLYNACQQVSRTSDCPLALTAVGDFCQLPPIADPGAPETGRFAFEAECWKPNFSDYTTRLTHIWRQDHERFVLALQTARRGAGGEALAYLQELGVRFEPRLSDAFEGTTLCATNHAVDCYNRRRLYLVPPEGVDHLPYVPSARWGIPGPDGRELSEWKHIPERFHFKLGAYVMILSNDTPDFQWVNGDCGTVVGGNNNHIVVRLKRNGSDVAIGKITRKRTTRKKPAGIYDAIVVRDEREYDGLAGATGEPPRQVVMMREPRPTWITGWIRYFPLRLAYATTVHKSQGLSLDALQLDLGSSFLASPAMMYVALSRCRTPEGLVLVGNPDQLVTKTNVDRVLPARVRIVSESGFLFSQ